MMGKLDLSHRRVVAKSYRYVVRNCLDRCENADNGNLMAVGQSPDWRRDWRKYGRTVET